MAVFSSQRILSSTVKSDHVVPPKHVIEKLQQKSINLQDHQERKKYQKEYISDVTLREFLLSNDGFHLGMAPAFFGFYAYFGCLAAWDDELSTETSKILATRILSVSGGSAGAMAAILISAGISPRKAAAYCSTITLDKFADPLGWGALFKGDLFEKLMYDFISKESPCFTSSGGSHSDNDCSDQKNKGANKEINIENALIPVAVSAFDIKTFTGKLLSKGCMAKAARASATFPCLFQPVVLQDNDEGSEKSSNKSSSLLIDGGITDSSGLQGFKAIVSSYNYNDGEKKDRPNRILPKRIVNIVVGDFGFDGKPMTPSSISSNILGNKNNSDTTNKHCVEEVLSIRIFNTPQCGPWAMENGPRALEAANKAMLASLDLPLYKGTERGHFCIDIDATDFVPNLPVNK